MDDKIKRPHPKFKPITLLPYNLLAIHKDSHVIAKVKPTIRIIHIIAPQVIKTDVTNFRELVQRLTGKSGKEETKGSKCKRRRMIPNSSTTSEKLEEKLISSGFPTNSKEANNHKGSPISLMTKVDKIDVEIAINGPKNVIWGSGDNNQNPSSSTSGFLDGFSDWNYGFVHDLVDGFPLPNNPPVTSSHHHHRHMDLFGDIRFS